MKVSWLESAECEFYDAALYYGSIDSDLGEQFAACAEVAVAEIAAHPELFRKFDGQVRKARLRRFPYAIVYLLNSDTIRIVAMMHLHKQPGYWRKRIR
ncbi:type II toxin-antitoxin system RelE/ParE family toxin [Phragmitibacter flavus]|nr:type II toxin-antitoxin system RelE/ParE family toxin [Phragmitibacter flavus]